MKHAKILQPYKDSLLVAGPMGSPNTGHVARAGLGPPRGQPVLGPCQPKHQGGQHPVWFQPGASPWWLQMRGAGDRICCTFTTYNVLGLLFGALVVSRHLHSSTCTSSRWACRPGWQSIKPRFSVDSRFISRS